MQCARQIRSVAISGNRWREKSHDLQVRMVGEMYRAGVPILAGTDVLNQYCLPGFLDADTLVDIRITTRINAVLANGRQHEHSGIEKLLIDAEKAAATPQNHSKSSGPPSLQARCQVGKLRP